MHKLFLKLANPNSSYRVKVCCLICTVLVVEMAACFNTAIIRIHVGVVLLLLKGKFTLKQFTLKQKF